MTIMLMDRLWRSAGACLFVAVFRIAAITLVVLLTSRTATAAEVASQPTLTAGSAVAPPKSASSEDDFTGDRLVLKSNVYGLTRLHDNIAGWIAMRGTILRVTKDETSDNDRLLVVVDTVPCVVEGTGQSVSARRDRIHLGVGGLVDCPTDKNAVAKLVQTGEVYSIPKEELQKYGYYRSGWVYGALLVPYKYYFHDKSFASAATIGPYLGYRMGGLGFDTAFVASVGLSSLSVANPSGNGDTSTIQGFSAAIGLIGGVSKNKNPLRFGLMVGRDWAGSNSAVSYKHEGKTWAAVQIGFSFSE